MAQDHQYIGVDFFARDIHEVARDLLGRELIRSVDGAERRGRIVEVEVYEGGNDRASHARSGSPTSRTAPMFADPGTIYVYKIYGMYHCLNLRAPSQDGPGAILIRACEPIAGAASMAIDRGLIDARCDYEERLQTKLLSGPGKLCQALDIDSEISGSLLGETLRIGVGEGLWQQDRARIKTTARVGLNPKTCGESVDWLWRYIQADCGWTSC